MARFFQGTLWKLREVAGDEGKVSWEREKEVRVGVVKESCGFLAFWNGAKPSG